MQVGCKVEDMIITNNIDLPYINCDGDCSDSDYNKYSINDEASAKSENDQEQDGEAWWEKNGRKLHGMKVYYAENDVDEPIPYLY